VCSTVYGTAHRDVLPVHFTARCYDVLRPYEYMHALALKVGVLNVGQSSSSAGGISVGRLTSGSPPSESKPSLVLLTSTRRGRRATTAVYSRHNESIRRSPYVVTSLVCHRPRLPYVTPRATPRLLIHSPALALSRPRSRTSPSFVTRLLAHLTHDTHTQGYT
jgi:hypothetical protein